jgi:hypothetical protein
MLIFAGLHLMLLTFKGQDYLEQTFAEPLLCVMFHLEAHYMTTRPSFQVGLIRLLQEHIKIMPKADLKGATLFQGLLWDAQLQGADLRGADLRDAILGRSDLSCANLIKAELSGAKAVHANLQSTRLEEANLQEAVLRWAILRDASLQNADLRGAILDDADLHGADLRGVRNIEPKQIIAAQNWRDGLYDDDFRKELDEYYETRSHH